MKILVADDEPFLRDMIARVLEGDGHEVTLASDGAEALELFQTNPFDVILTDFSMPKLNGLELAQAARAIKPTQKIVLLTGLGDHTGGAARSFIDRTLGKPLRIDALSAAIQEMGGSAKS